MNDQNILSMLLNKKTMYRITPKLIVLLFLFTTLACHKMPIQEDPKEDPKPIIPTEITLEQIEIIPSTLIEISGMIPSGSNHFIAHNDGGDEPNLYLLNATNCEILDTVKINNFKNKDWEGIAQSKDEIFVGNFGNNKGNRKDLEIIKIKKEGIFDSKEIEGTALPFSYEDQTNFEKGDNHNFDCEAMISIDNSLFLFSKNRQDLKTNVYQLNTNNSNYQKAEKVASFDTKALVTDAFHDTINNRLLLLCYTYESGFFESSLWIFKDVGNGINFENAHHLTLSRDLQFESISMLDDKYIYIANEGNPFHNGVLYKADISYWK